MPFPPLRPPLGHTAEQVHTEEDIEHETFFGDAPDDMDSAGVTIGGGVEPKEYEDDGCVEEPSWAASLRRSGNTASPRILHHDMDEDVIDNDHDLQPPLGDHSDMPPLDDDDMLCGEDQPADDHEEDIGLHNLDRDERFADTGPHGGSPHVPDVFSDVDQDLRFRSDGDRDDRLFPGGDKDERFQGLGVPTETGGPGVLRPPRPRLRMPDPTIGRPFFPRDTRMRPPLTGEFRPPVSFGNEQRPPRPVHPGPRPFPPSRPDMELQSRADHRMLQPGTEHRLPLQGEGQPGFKPLMSSDPRMPPPRVGEPRMRPPFRPQGAGDNGVRPPGNWPRRPPAPYGDNTRPQGPRLGQRFHGQRPRHGNNWPPSPLNRQDKDSAVHNQSPKLALLDRFWKHVGHIFGEGSEKINEMRVKFLKDQIKDNIEYLTTNDGDHFLDAQRNWEAMDTCIGYLDLKVSTQKTIDNVENSDLSSSDHVDSLNECWTKVSDMEEQLEFFTDTDILGSEILNRLLHNCSLLKDFLANLMLKC